jgi:hypothetical protein
MSKHIIVVVASLFCMMITMSFVSHTVRSQWMADYAQLVILLMTVFLLAKYAQREFAAPSAAPPAAPPAPLATPPATPRPAAPPAAHP